MDSENELSALLVDHFNTEHPDSLLFVSRVLGGRPDAISATAADIDVAGIDLLVDDGTEIDTVRVDFVEPASELEGVSIAALQLVLAARAKSGEEGLTSAERVAAVMSQVRTFVTSVVRTEQITPHVRQITFGGGDLATFTPISPDQFLYVLAPPRGRDELTIDQSFTWEQFREMPDAERPIGAYYTVRRWRPDVHEIDMLFVLHGDAGEGSAWAERAQPGDPVALWGPRTGFEPPADTDRYLLVGDETGLPAIAAILESLPGGTPVRVIAEVSDESEQQPLPTSESVDVTWIHRGDTPAGTTTALVDAVKSLEWPSGKAYAWGGAESRIVTAIRRYVRDEVGLAHEAVSMTGYWRLD